MSPHMADDLRNLDKHYRLLAWLLGELERYYGAEEILSMVEAVLVARRQARQRERGLRLVRREEK